MRRVLLPLKSAAEVLHLSFDFTSSLLANDALSGTPVVTIATYLGADPIATSMVSGVASRAGNVVTQKVSAGVEGNTYIATCTCPTSLGGSLQLAGFLTVAPSHISAA